MNAVANYAPAGFFVLRTPLLPLDLFERWAERPAAGAAAPRRVHEDRVRRRLRETVQDPRVLEALFLASPSLHQRLHYWMDDPLGAKGRKIEAALVKYLSRMCSRSTPFGLFAGVSTGAVGTGTRLVLGDPSTCRKHARLDNGHVCRLAERLLGDDTIRRQVPFFPNDTICASGDRLRYVAYEAGARSRTYRLAGVENTRAVAAVLRQARSGATLGALAAHVAHGEHVDEDEARAFVDAMVDCRLLVSALEPAITGEEPLRSMLATVHALEHKTDDVMRLTALERKIADLNAARVGSPVQDYEAIRAELDGPDAPRYAADALQVDMFKPAQGLSIDAGLVQEIAQCAGLVYAATATRSRAIDGFIRRFVKRYERQRVPLGDVLDAEKGIGFGDAGADESHLLQGLKFDKGDAAAVEPRSPFGDYLARRFADAIRDGSDEIEIARADLARFRRDDLPPPGSICAKIVPVQSDAAGIAKAHVRFLSGSGSTLFGRFCHGDDRLRAFTAALVADEAKQRPDTVFAEIVHLPQGRVGNVVARPCFTDYEIVYLGRSGRPLDKQVRLDDLMLSVEDGRLVLWSNRLEREVVPRLSSAHHFLGKGNLGVYRFLASLQFAGTGIFGPAWPASLQGMPYLPRISVGRVQLTHRQWNLAAADLEALRSAWASDAPGRFAEAARAYRLPRFVAIVEHDQALTIDFDNPLSCRLFFDLAAGARSLRLEEAYVPAQDAAVRDGQHRYASEIFVPLLLRQDDAVDRQGPASRAVADADGAARTLAPGGECLYVKIYCGAATADRLIGGTLHDLVQGWKAAEQVDQWFFVRYGDPEAHLRVRLFGPPAALWGGVLMALHAALRPFLADRTVWNIQVDTYERELERYGGVAGMARCERIFHADSEAVARLIAIGRNCTPENNGEHAILGVNALLKDFDIDASDRLHFLRSLAAGFAGEFDFGKDQAIALGKKFREMRGKIHALASEADLARSEVRDIYRARSDIVRAEASHLLQELGRMRQRQICASVIHMFVNRFFRSRQRQHEMVMYDLLRRHYESLAGRERAEH